MVPEEASLAGRSVVVELEELRQRLLLRSKSSDIPPVAHPVQVPEVALSQAASKVKWETSLSPEVAARVGVKPETVAPELAQDIESPVENPRSVMPKVGSVEPISMLASTVENLSQPTEAFREHFANLGKLMEPIDRATESTEQALRRIAGLHEHLSSLASNFQSVKAFAEQVKALSASFEPMKGLNSQLDMVTQALYASVKEVDAAFGPVKGFQGKVRQLAAALDAMDKLQGQISALAETFRPVAEKPAPAKQSEKPAPVAQAA